MLQDGAELLYVSEQLGHRSPSFTLDRYAHLLPRNRRGNVNGLDRLAPTGTPASPATETFVLSAPDDVPETQAAHGELKAGARSRTADLLITNTTPASTTVSHGDVLSKKSKG